MINGIIQIRSRIFESGLFYKAVQLLGIPQVPFGIDNTLDFFSERKAQSSVPGSGAEPAAHERRAGTHRDRPDETAL